MVRILPNGDIVQDDDPRVQRKVNQRRSNFGTIHSERNAPASAFGGRLQADDSIPYHGGQHHQGEGPTLFDTWNQKLVQIGIPRWNIGSLTVEPLMTVMFLSVMLIFGLPGLMFLGVLYAVVSFSNRGTPTRQNMGSYGNVQTTHRRSDPHQGGRRLGD